MGLAGAQIELLDAYLTPSGTGELYFFGNIGLCCGIV